MSAQLQSAQRAYDNRLPPDIDAVAEAPPGYRAAVISEVMAEKRFAYRWAMDCGFSDELISSAWEAGAADDADRAINACKALYESMERMAQDEADRRIEKEYAENETEAAICRREFNEDR